LKLPKRFRAKGGALDFDALASLMSEQSRVAESSSLSIATIALIAFWVVAILDSYRAGRVAGKVHEAPLKKKT
jgi:tetrahydromethanopterin S-methyltransferase subunit D